LIIQRSREIAYELLELARPGEGPAFKICRILKKYNVRIHVKSSFNNEEGTIVMPREEMMEKFVISGVTSKKDEAKITLRDIPDRPGIAAEVFQELAEKKIFVNMIVQSTGHGNKASISFTVLNSDLKKALEVSEDLKKKLSATSVEHKKDIVIVSAVGVGMLSSYGVAGRMFKVLSDHNINIEMISTSEIGISCVIDGLMPSW
jgi:aspartate kinase